MSDSIDVKIFFGFLQQGEIKMHLNQSALWKEAKLLQNQGLVETYFQDKEYIGLYIESGLLYSQIKLKEKELKNQLQLYCSKLSLDKYKIYLFPLVFLA